MARLTRKDMQGQTRTKLLIAAEKTFARQGVDAASIRDIAEAAGYSLGAFYSNFDSKDAMLLEVAERHMREDLKVFRAIIDETQGGDFKETMAGITAWLQTLQKNKDVMALGLELQMYANRCPAFAKKYDRIKEQRQTELADGLKAVFDRLGLVPKLDPLQMATAFAALWSGFAIEGSVKWAKPIEEIVMLLFNALLESSVPVSGADSSLRRK